MGIGECRVVQKKDDTDRGIQDGEIIFIKQGPFNFMPLVEQYEKENKELHGGSLKAILDGKQGLSDRELLRRERGLINAYIKYPCRATLIEDAKGKAPGSLKSAIYIEYDNYLQLISHHLPDPLHLNADFIKYLRDKDNLLDQFADQFVMTLPSPRSEYYLQ